MLVLETEPDQEKMSSWENQTKKKLEYIHEPTRIRVGHGIHSHTVTNQNILRFSETPCYLGKQLSHFCDDFEAH